MRPRYRLGGALSCYALLDYYNIRRIHRQRGAPWVVQRIFDTIGTAALTPAARFRVRFYRGWYGKAALTQRGQRRPSTPLTAPTSPLPQPGRNERTKERSA